MFWKRLLILIKIKKGICRRPDVCFCKGEYYGKNCEISVCYGINSTNENGIF
jgi:hypothetical protein